jgi:hypothetical protein
MRAVLAEEDLFARKLRQVLARDGTKTRQARANSAIRSGTALPGPAHKSAAEACGQAASRCASFARVELWARPWSRRLRLFCILVVDRRVKGKHLRHRSLLRHALDGTLEVRLQNAAVPIDSDGHRRTFQVLRLNRVQQNPPRLVDGKSACGPADGLVSPSLLGACRNSISRSPTRYRSPAVHGPAHS